MFDVRSNVAQETGQQQGRVRPLLTFLVAIAIIAAGLSCSQGAGPAEYSYSSSDAVRGTVLTLHVLEDSIYDAGEFSLVLEQRGPLTTAEVVARDAEGLRALYLELEYDAETMTAVDASCGRSLAGQGNVLELAVLNNPGTAYYGQVLANWPELPGFSGDGVVAEFKFAPAPAEETAAAGKHRVSAVPVCDKAKHYLNFNPKSSAFLWYYVNPGDYDQNGEVGIADLTPLGANFNDEGPFEVGDARMMIDGDGNGVINIADITPIGANFGNHIDSFAVYGSENGGDYPDGNAAANGSGACLIGNRPFGAGNGGGALRKYWELAMETPVIGTAHYWMRPASYGDEGTPSQLVTHEQEWHLSDVFTYQPSAEPFEVRGMSMASVAGRPGIFAIIRNLNSDAVYLYYITAADTVGSDWKTPVSAITGSMIQSSPSLAEIDGLPAVTWFEDFVVTGLRFMHGTNSAGTAWTAPVTIDTQSYAGISSRLLEFEGKPLVVYSTGASEFCLSMAEDASGASWLPKVHISGSTDSFTFDAKVLPGGVGTAMEDEDTGGVDFYFAQISDGVATVMPREALIGDYISSSRSIDLGYCGGAPYLATTRASDNKLHYCFASGPTGGGWTAPASVALSGVVDKCSGTVAYGLPWVCYYDPSAGQLSSGHALEPASNLWVNEAAVTDSASGINYVKMAIAAGHPAVAYNVDESKTIFFAVYY